MGSTDNGEGSANITRIWLSMPLSTMREQRSQQAAPTRAKRQNSAAKFSICCKKKGKSSSPRFEKISYDAFQVCICHGDVARAKVFASLAVDAKRVWNGTDSCELPQKEELARRPESHRLAFQTKKWSFAGSSSSSSSKLAASPHSDEWLWRRAG